LDDECQCEEVNARNAEIPTPSGTKGDPHFVMWNGKHFDFHGGCDLVLVDGTFLYLRCVLLLVLS